VAAGTIIVPEQLSSGLVEQELTMSSLGRRRNGGCAGKVMIGKVIGIACSQRDACSDAKAYLRHRDQVCSGNEVSDDVFAFTPAAEVA